MENAIEQARASEIEMAKDILKRLDTEVRQIPSQQNRSESYGSECCIYMVPKRLRNVNWKAYTPLLISIGPLHRENKRLVEAMEKEKRKYFKNLTERVGMDEKKMCDIVISIMNQEKRLRHCYSEKFKSIESSDFVEMILLDAVFIIHFFLESYDDTGPKNFETKNLREDLMLLENQLPLFIIREIYDRVNSCSQDSKAIPFLDLATCHFGKYSFLKRVETSPDVEKETILDVEKETSLGVEGSRHFTDLLRNLMLCKTSPGVEKETSPDVKKEPRHLTDLLRNLMLSGAIKRSYSFDPVKLKYSAVRLHKAGVRFQAARDECLVNIKFEKRVLKIPQLEVDHNFERLVRNIMAMEQCLYKSEAYICSYIKFMDLLINSAEDVGLLVEKQIIVHRLGNDAAVSNMIHNLCENIGDSYTCFSYISQRLNAHYENRFNRVVASAATIGLILTLIQTICSVISLFLS